jgi:hypothetical protein
LHRRPHGNEPHLVVNKTRNVLAGGVSTGQTRHVSALWQSLDRW